jgi:uncharacterized repeat protein (TIGR03803 family)
MHRALIPPTLNHVSTFLHSGKGTWKQSYAYALATMLALAAAPRAAQGQTLTVLYSFKGGADGSGPTASLIRDTEGNLYGTTYLGGDLKCGTRAGCGTIFKLDATGKETVLHRFAGGAAGSNPFAGLIRDPEGNLYGTTVYGGDLNCGDPSGCGTVFKLDATGKKTVLHSFAGPPDGSTPYGGLVRDAQGNLYGTTVFGGNYGTVFKMDATGREAVLHSFTGGKDGSYPDSGVIRDAAGNLFGTTTYGGPSNLGTAFELDRTGKETMLYSFTGVDGDLPSAGLVPVGESLYGTTPYGGAFHEGNVFKMDKTGKVTGLHDFLGGGQEGSAPAAALIHDAAGNVYGTTLYGGFYNQGTLFKVDFTGNATVLHTFTGGADGGIPEAGVIRDASGNLYGTTMSGGAFGFGTVFKIAP